MALLSPELRLVSSQLPLLLEDKSDTTVARSQLDIRTFFISFHYQRALRQVPSRSITLTVHRWRT